MKTNLLEFVPYRWYTGFRVRVSFWRESRNATFIGRYDEFYNVPVYRRAAIKAGEDFVTSDGRIIPNSYLTTPADPPLRYAYCSDTAYNEALLPIIEGVDLLYHEATFGDDAEALAKETCHSTARQAAIIARKAGVKQLLLGHFSARYENEQQLLEQAREEFAPSFWQEKNWKLYWGDRWLGQTKSPVECFYNVYFSFVGGVDNMKNTLKH